MEESVKPVRTEPRSLKAAVHKARVEEAERTDVIVHLHAAEAARLELLREALAPVGVHVDRRLVEERDADVRELLEQREPDA